MVYKSKAAAKALEIQAAADTREDPHADDEAADSKEGDLPSSVVGPLDGLLPLSNVRRIILTDSDVARVSHEGLVAITKATDLLLGILAR